MNERIKELANRLGPVATIGNWGRVEWADNVYPQLGDKMYASIDLEKFAELIVKECDYLIQQQVSLKYKDGWEQCGLSDDWAGGHYGASILSRTVIKQHFGVEE
jgi:hypothetical protein